REFRRNCGYVGCVTYFSRSTSWEGEGYLALLGNWLHIPIPCLFIIVYAPQDQWRKRKLWNDLDQLISAHNSFTIVLGDFNEVRSPEEWKGTVFYSRGASRFNNFISTSGLIDLPMGAKRYTRMNNLGNKLSKINRVLVSHHVIDLWPNSHTIALPREYSDHTPILFSNLTADFGATPFKLYNSWITHKDFPRLVNECWNSCNSGFIYNGSCPTSVSFKTKLQQLKSTIKQWRRQIVDMENMVSNDLRLKIDCLDRNTESSFLTDDEILSRTAHVKSLADLEHAKILDLRQKAKIQWALDGDENSRFFHGMINNRRNRSRINGLNIHGDWATDPTSIKNHIFLHFASRFKEENRSRPSFNSNLFKRLSLDEVQLLDYPFSNLEIKEAIWDCGSDKAPGPHGDVQMAFIKGRQIIDGPLMVNEIITWAKKHKKRLMFLKVDFDKAFDSLSWSFLFSIMEQVGFSGKWINWIRSCLDSAFASVLVNGSPTKEFKLERGLRQGDPLSPFLFILAMEALNVAFLEATNSNIFHGVQLMLFLLDVGSRSLNPFLVAWESITFQSSKLLRRLFISLKAFEDGSFGVGIRKMKKSLGLLGRKFRIEENALWFRVVRSIHGSSGGILNDSICKQSSGTWSQISKLKGNPNNVGINLPMLFKKKLGNGRDTSFWHDNRLGGSSLRDTFPRLYGLETMKNCLVFEHAPTAARTIPAGNSNGNSFFLHHEVLQYNNGLIMQPNIPLAGTLFHWAWRRTLRSQEENVELCELQDLLLNLNLSMKQDTWEFTPDPLRCFSVKSMRKTISNTLNNATIQSTRWNKLLPSKVNVMSWWVCNQRLPNRANLDKHGARSIKGYTPCSPFIDSDNDSDDGEALNELYEYGNAGTLGVNENYDAPVLVLERGLLNYEGDPVLVGCVKDFKTLPNIHTVCSSEGFTRLKINYLGGFWVLLEFNSFQSCEKFYTHEGIKSWFSTVSQWTPNFEIQDRVGKVSIVCAKEVTGWVPEFRDGTYSQSDDGSDNNSVGKHDWVEEEDDNEVTTPSGDPFGIEDLILKTSKIHKKDQRT
ncbi:RNA-directed DNA polymerase, eukaryota, reverse transcriptase zinc-binding domain protein, partial [Tanacetum coccineum]